MACGNRPVVMAMCIGVAACAAVPQAPPRGRTQQLAIHTDPAGAACWIWQEGAIVASVAATPGAAEVPRRPASIDVVCHRDGYLEARMTLSVAFADDVELEAGTIPWRPSRSAPALVADFLAQGAVAAFPPIFLGVVAAGAAAAAAAEAERRPDISYAYRALPDIMLVPTTFESESSRDAFFTKLKGKLEATATAQLASIDTHCRVWPCTPSDLACPSPVCGHARILAEEQLRIQLDQIPALREQTRLAGP